MEHVNQQSAPRTPEQLKHLFEEREIGGARTVQQRGEIWQLKLHSVIPLVNVVDRRVQVFAELGQIESCG